MGIRGIKAQVVPTPRKEGKIIRIKVEPLEFVVNGVHGVRVHGVRDNIEVIIPLVADPG
jgi:hypothetical protein